MMRVQLQFAPYGRFANSEANQELHEQTIEQTIKARLEDWTLERL